MFGENLKNARKLKNLTLINVGMKINTTHATISRYENNKLEPNLDTLKKLCELYGVSADYILGLPEGLKFPKG
ncbi:MAG: helix-turn-helix transcriptional regulator [Clostridia bacterium]|nr:helix-turn-helix transcriptional regulator [Clostridia bacterium]